MPVDPRSTRDRLFHLLESEYRSVVADVRPLRHEQLLELPGAHEGRIPPVFAAVDMLWFRGIDEALGFVHGDIGHRAGYVLAGTTFGLERLLAQEVRVV
jgi:hypothetical protein